MTELSEDFLMRLSEWDAMKLETAGGRASDMVLQKIWLWWED
jgi:hypothetical protein